jgi:hypothetical protein
MNTQEKRIRRSQEQLIADLEARIAGLKAKAAQKQVKRDPSLKHVNKAIKLIDIAASECQDNATKRALGEARSTLSACLSLNGVLVPVGTRVRRPVQKTEQMGERLLDYVLLNPGKRGEQIAAALATDVGTMRPSMQKLIADKKVKTQGQRRGMAYFGA